MNVRERKRASGNIGFKTCFNKEDAQPKVSRRDQHSDHGIRSPTPSRDLFDQSINERT